MNEVDAMDPLLLYQIESEERIKIRRSGGFLFADGRHDSDRDATSKTEWN